MDELRSFRDRLTFSEVRFQAIAQTATDAIVISDENATIVFANHKAFEIFGFRDGELIGLNLNVIMPEKHRQAHTAGMQRFMKTGLPKLVGHTVEIEGLRKDGTVFPLELSLSSWKEEGNYFFSGIMRDISRRKQLEQEKENTGQLLQNQQKELEAANKELQLFQEELQATNEELRASEEELRASNEELLRKEEQLQAWNARLEEKVNARTLELQQARTEAERHRDRLERFLMEAPAIICVHSGPDFIFEFVNPQYQRVFPGRQLLGKPLLEGLPELADQPIWPIVQRVYQTGETYVGNEVLMPLASHDGGPLQNNYYTFIYQARFNAENQVDGIMVFAYDVTQQVQARKVLEESAARLNFMADAMPQKVWTAKANGDVDYFNQKWLDYTGLSFEALKDWGWKSIIHPDDWEENEKVWMYSIETGLDFQLEHRLRGKDNEYRWHLSRGLAQRSTDGSISMWIGTNTDIHDRRLANEKLLLAQEDLKATNIELNKINNDLDNFIYTASHDLRSPILNLEGLVALARKNFNDKIEDKDRSVLEMMESSILRLKSTILDLAEITKTQKGSKEVPEQLSFKDILEELKADLAGNLEVSDVNFREDLQVTRLLYAKKNLRSILYNLLSNAIKYQSPKRPLVVRIKTYREEEHTVLSVTDNGIGLSQEQLPKLFTMFKRLHTHVEGTGIGLYIVKRIVENAGGRIEVESNLDRGTTFKVYFKS
ncbi:PAS domain S-box protein [Cesiribacter sp. SM1]|uniref:PAS domain S-box protein n=1 Tax=Cesiribacter sp. SM1 TaxID=2861196 RepID=UPI001CD25F76|nr:PAS domain S-box protein [Cesiribacter sp. SM1]